MSYLFNYKTKEEARLIELAVVITGNHYIQLEKENQILVTITRNNEQEFMTKLSNYLG